jgi:predicted phage baseplate assembly protein
MSGADPCGREDLSPRRPENRPGLPEIDYRIGTHSAFLRRMLHGIPRQGVHSVAAPPLLGLTARDTSDPSIALMDAWAAALDVLTFYSERIANEGYLPTATERRSLVELARSIGYEFAPGVAASVHLAFTVESADDPFRAVEVPVGTQAMSVPQEKGALPQAYETVETITARAEWNAMPARREEPQHLALFHDPKGQEARHGALFLFDLDNSFDLDAAVAAGELDPAEVVTVSDAAELSPFYPLSAALDLVAALADRQADAALNPEIEPVLKAVPASEVFLRGTGLGLSPGDRLLAVGARRSGGGQAAVAAAFRVEEAEVDRAYDSTRLLLAQFGSTAAPRRLRLPFLRMAKLRIGTVPSAPVAFSAAMVDEQVRRTAWSASGLGAFLRTQSWPRLQLMRLIRKAPEVTAPPLGEAAPGFHALRQTLGFFGNSAARWETLAKPDESRGGKEDDPYPASWDGPERSIWTDSQGAGFANADAFLEREVEEIAPGQWVLLETPTAEVLPLRVAAAAGASRADYASSGKTTGLTFRSAAGDDLKTADKPETYTFRGARAHVVSQPLAAAGAPIREEFGSEAKELALDTLYLDLQPGRPVSVSGERADAPGVPQSETLVIDEVLHVGGVTRLLLRSAPKLAYRRDSLRVNGNVALATHGESQQEALGSGDAARPNQAFRLAKTPLTFVSAATETGIATTLTVRVDGIAWREVPSLHDADAQDEVYQLRIDEDGTTRVVFGDGIHGRRLPTGALNVTAQYRAGLGPVGDAADGAVSQLRTRPLGIRSVVNPSPAAGSAMPEVLEDARIRAPRSVRALGRIVSLTDYADFALTYAGIGKAAAAALWLEDRRIAHLTVAPEQEGVFEESTTTLANLRAAVARFRNPTHEALVAPHVPRLFRLAARVQHDRRRLPEDVEAALRAALSARFGWRMRDLAQSVSASEVIAAMHAVPGIVGVTLTGLSLYEEGASLLDEVADLLRARPARVEHDAAGRPAAMAAELLTLLGAGVELTLEAADA